MNAIFKRSLVGVVCLLFALLFYLMPKLNSGQSEVPLVNAQSQCTALTTPKNILPLSPTLINFDTLSDGAVIGSAYRSSLGVSFENGPTAKALISKQPGVAFSDPNVAVEPAPSSPAAGGVPMTITFDTAKSAVGFYYGGNQTTEQPGVLVTAFDTKGNFLCQVRDSAVVPANVDRFFGISAGAQVIGKITIDYGVTAVPETIDNLYFVPGPGVRPTRVPAPAWTAVPTTAPTAGPAPTATPVLPLLPYINPAVSQIIQGPLLLPPDFSIHGIEITQGIQCFDTSKGLASCGNNSLPVVDQKSTTARIYLKAANGASVYNNVPVRLHIRANGVWYVADSSGKTTLAINQLNNDSANIWFNVNFSSPVAVDFYAEVDPDNLYAETNEGNNRYPAGSGYLTMTFQPRAAMTIVGERLHYHPTGYAGTQNAAGWAVNGGAASWYAQILPVRDNGINYSVASGYLDWTTDLNAANGVNQHALISSLNVQWMIQNLFGWWFAGPFSGAQHVYGWAPSAGYSGGHADMPVYPHAGGLGVVGIGSDAAGTSTDVPGPGALIFGHELTHDYDIKHTNTADSCGSSDNTSLFPYTSSSIQEVGYNPVTGKIYDPATTHDLMSYCPSGGSKQGWISPYTWSQMFGKLTLASLSLAEANPHLVKPYAFFGAIPAESLKIEATLFNPATSPAQEGKFGPLYKTQGVLAQPPLGSAASPYKIELRNNLGDPLATYFLDVNFASEYSGHDAPPPPFTEADNAQEGVSNIVDWVSGTTSIVLLKNNLVLDTVFVSPNAPQVLFTAPTAKEDWLAGSTHHLAWSGLDLDGNPLSYSLFYSHDAGASWSLLASNLAASSLDVATDSLAGGSDVRFRVVVTDGVNTGQDETVEAISVPNKAPIATILNPIANQAFLPGSLVVLEGTALDLEDGTLPNGSLSWSSDKQGSLGTGPSLGLNVLQPGWHTITLTASDSLNVKGSTTVRVFIGYRTFAPSIVR